MMEQRRGCGIRVIGALYLCCDGLAVECDRLPIRLDACTFCGQGFKQSRGFTELDFEALFGDHLGCKDPFICPLCKPKKGETKLLLWVGRKFYTPESFSLEANDMGVSKRIPFIPDSLVLGRTWVLLAHPDACKVRQWLWRCTECGELFEIPELILEDELQEWDDVAVDSVQVFNEEGNPAYYHYRTTTALSRHAAKHRKRGVEFSMVEEEGVISRPGIFRAFIPTRIEMPITIDQSKNEQFVADLKKRGITPVVVKPVFKLKCLQCGWTGNSSEFKVVGEALNCPKCGRWELSHVDYNKKGEPVAVGLEHVAL